jgi:hypothetical protein
MLSKPRPCLDAEFFFVFLPSFTMKIIKDIKVISMIESGKVDEQLTRPTPEAFESFANTIS